jgi:hypothetical protein
MRAEIRVVTPVDERWLFSILIKAPSLLGEEK